MILSVSLSWHYLPPGVVVWLSFAGCQISAREGSAENSTSDYSNI